MRPEFVRPKFDQSYWNCPPFSDVRCSEPVAKEQALVLTPSHRLAMVCIHFDEHRQAAGIEAIDMHARPLSARRVRDSLSDRQQLPVAAACWPQRPAPGF